MTLWKGASEDGQAPAQSYIFHIDKRKSGHCRVF